MKQHIAKHDIWVTQTGQGMPRLFVHCSLGRGLSLAPLAEALPEGANTFFDLPGHGKSGPWNGTEYQSDVANIAGHLAEGPTHVIGHSFGATVALRLAVERPEKVARLTLIEPVFFAAANDAKASAAHRAAFAPFVEAFEAGDLDRASAVFTQMWGAGPAWANLPDRHRALIRSQIHLVAAAAPAIEDDVHGLVARLSTVRCPVDLIEGGRSQPIMQAIMDGLAASLPNTTRRRIAGAGHMVPITHPNEVAKALADSS